MHSATARFAAMAMASPRSAPKMYWHFYTGTNWDWETLIDVAQDGDTFDIGHAVENL
jgi:hypothetical protein